MTNSNIKKKKQLGIPFGTACNRLRKMIMFNLVRDAGRDSCFRCGKKIESVEEFSIEHKKPWLDIDTNLFWNLDNIAFSHLSCNIGHGKRRPKQKPNHGTHSGYAHSGCRCKLCVKAQQEYQATYYEKKREQHARTD